MSIKREGLGLQRKKTCVNQDRGFGPTKKKNMCQSRERVWACKEKQTCVNQERGFGPATRIKPWQSERGLRPPTKNILFSANWKPLLSQTKNRI